MTAKRLFAKKTTEFKSSASEALATYPVMRIFLQDSLPTLGDNHARLCCHSFFALCDVLDTLQMLGSTGNVNAEADDLDAKVCRRLQLFKSCYGETRVLPKATFTWETSLDALAASSRVSYTRGGTRRSNATLTTWTTCRQGPRNISCNGVGEAFG